MLVEMFHKQKNRRFKVIGECNDILILEPIEKTFIESLGGITYYIDRKEVKIVDE